MRRRLTLSLSALAMLFAAAFAASSNVTTASADSSAPQNAAVDYSLPLNAMGELGWNGPD